MQKEQGLQNKQSTKKKRHTCFCLLKKIIDRIFYWIGVFVTLLGVPSFIFSLLIRVPITVSEPLDHEKPFSSTATITNNSVTTIKDVIVYVSFDTIEIKKWRTINRWKK